MTAFDRYERGRWSGRAGAYTRSFALLCAYAGEGLLDAASVRAGTAVLDVGTGPGTVAALAATRGARVAAVDPEPSMVSAASRLVPDVRVGALPAADVARVRAAYDRLIVGYLGAGGLLELPTAALVGSGVRGG